MATKFRKRKSTVKSSLTMILAQIETQEAVDPNWRDALSISYSCNAATTASLTKQFSKLVTKKTNASSMCSGLSLLFLFLYFSKQFPFKRLCCTFLFTNAFNNTFSCNKQFIQSSGIMLFKYEHSYLRSYFSSFDHSVQLSPITCNKIQESTQPSR